jgi:hypothetical protein
LHTTNRITQPWKNFLKVNFERHNFSFKTILINRLKFYLGLTYRKDIISKSYYTHPDKEVIKFIKEMFKEAINKKILTSLEVEESLKKKYISRFVIE